MKASTCLLVCFFFGVQGATIRNPEEELVKTATCLRESGVSFDSLQKINVGQFVDDPSLKEYLLCVSKNAGFQNEAGYLQSDMIRLRLKGGHYSSDTIDEVIIHCTQNKETPQETAFQFMKCVYVNTIQKKYS